MFFTVLGGWAVYPAPAGSAHGAADNAANATSLKFTVRGHTVYGTYRVSTYYVLRMDDVTFCYFLVQ